MKELLSKYRSRLLREAAVNSLIGGIAAGSVSEFVFLAVLHLISRKPAAYIILLVAAVPFAAAAVMLFAFKFYPTMKKVAARIDETGLQERVGTMLELEKENTYMAELQRKDAEKHLATVTPRQMKSNYRKKRIIFSASAAALAITLLFVPYTIMDVFAGAPDVDEQEAEMIRNLLDELRKKIDEAEVSDELKEKLGEVVDKLEDSLSDEDSSLDKAAKISEAKAKLEQLLEDSLTKISIGSALRQYESTEELGKAIGKGDTEAVKTALANMKESFLSVDGGERSDRLSLVSGDIQSALELSGVQAGDALYDALDKYSDSLALSAQETADGNDAAGDIESAVSNAESEITAALEEQAKLEEAAEGFDELMEDAKDELFGNKPEESGGEGEETSDGENPDGENPDGENPDGDNQSGEAPNGEMPGGELPDGEIPEGGMTGGDGEEGQSNMTEKIYDTYSGNVEYGELYAAYYAEYLAALDSGEVPEELEEIIGQYFDSLNK